LRNYACWQKKIGQGEKPETVWPETSLTTVRLTRRAVDEDRRNPWRAQRGHHRNFWIL
jgi:hypothetical protein